ncbi:helix-turn-helix domain-containing protein [Streptomyces sp. NPDC001221]
MPSETPTDLIRTAEAAELLSVSIWTVRNWVKAGKVQGYQVGRLIKVSRAELLAYARPISPEK